MFLLNHWGSDCTLALAPWEVLRLIMNKTWFLTLSNSQWERGDACEGTILIQLSTPQCEFILDTFLRLYSRRRGGVAPASECWELGWEKVSLKDMWGDWRNGSLVTLNNTPFVSVIVLESQYLSLQILFSDCTAKGNYQTFLSVEIRKKELWK